MGPGWRIWWPELGCSSEGPETELEWLGYQLDVENKLVGGVETTLRFPAWVDG